MSIYATLWKLKFPAEGDDYAGCSWIGVSAQAVPPHIGHGWADRDPYADFLPPRIAEHSSTERAVVFITEGTPKGTARCPQEYVGPLLVLTGEEYSRLTFSDLHKRLCDALRSNRAPVIAEVTLPDGTHKIIRG